VERTALGRSGYATSTMIGMSSAVSDTSRLVTMHAMDERCECCIESSMGFVLVLPRGTAPGNVAPQGRARRRGVDPAVPGVNVMNHSLAAHVTVGGGIVPT